jgi:CubicO group peptidase (beta-lactamase class C family)
MVKWIFKWLTIAVLFVVITGFVPAWLGVFGLYWERYATTFLTNPLDPKFEWYKPLEKVEGNFSELLPLASKEDNPFPDSVLELAADYAGANDSEALLIAYQGKLIFERYWNNKDPDSLFAAHSMTKVLPALLIGMAMEDGYIRSIDDPVSDYLSEWDVDKRQGITIRHLLTMSSGVQESYDFRPTSARMKRAMGTDIVTPNIGVEIRFKPGQVFAHFNPNSQLLGIILQRATRQRFGDYLSKKLWKPIGAHDAFLFLDQPGGMVHTDCCMWSAIQDWMRIGELLRTKGMFNGEQIVPASWIDQMVTPSQTNPNYGMQLWLGNIYEEYRRYDPETDTFANYHSEPFMAEDVIFLDGLGKKRLYVIPSFGLVILRTGPNHSEWDDARVPNILTRALIAIAANSQKND